ncbi:DMT family transporter [Niallia sp. 03133]|uniref:DMT family transporter n=1 Tax=Niallia sp. 03133 TaxID=3458060 RepID=UPI004043AA60
MRSLVLGVLAAFFFAFTFVLNQSMKISGGSWIWSASLRYFFMVPLLILLVLFRSKLPPVWQELKKNPIPWLVWSSVGFGIFYAFICFASEYGPGWLVAGTWQLTIISGTLLTPFFYEKKTLPTGVTSLTRQKIPYNTLSFSLLIVAGIILMQVEYAMELSLINTLLCFIPIVIASFAYPLGNRKMMEVCNGRLDAYQRVLGMTIASLPFWFLLSFYGLWTVGFPKENQLIQSVIVALFSGVFATILFFAATDLVRDDMQKLGAVEATQSFEVLFALLGEILFLHADLPSMISLFGMILIVIGMILHSIFSHKRLDIKNSIST